jgi:hypothetical protein
MSMHLERAFITTTNCGSKGKKLANTAAKRKADAEHDAWLRKRGVHPDQLKTKQIKSVATIPNYREGIRSTAPLSNSVGNGFKNGVMENLHKEAPEVQKAILDKASRCMPLYNKGGYQYMTDGTDPTTVGSKSRRG